MARITPIRIRENDRKEYARLVRNAKSKINRTRKKHGVDLTGEVELPALDDFTTRAEFNEWKERASSFTNRHNLNYQYVTNPYGVTRSKVELNRMERTRRRDIELAKAEYNKYKDLQVKQGGKPFATVEQRTTHMSVPDVTGIKIPEKFDFRSVRSERTMRAIEEAGKKRTDPEHYDKKMDRMQRNFIDSLYQAFDSEADELAERLGELSDDEFYVLYLENIEFDFDHYYYTDDEVVKNVGSVEKMTDILNKFENEVLKKNEDLKGF